MNQICRLELNAFGSCCQAYFREVVDHILVHCFADFVCIGGVPPKSSFFCQMGRLFWPMKTSFSPFLRSGEVGSRRLNTKGLKQRRQQIVTRPYLHNNYRQFVEASLCLHRVIIKYSWSEYHMVYKIL